MPTQKKIDSVKKLTEKLAGAKSVILTNYQGLTHRQIEDLRKAVKKTGGDFMVVKNTLLKLAVEKTARAQFADFAKDSNGPTALLLAYENELLPLKEVASYIKQFQLPSLKIGILDEKLLDSSELMAIASLPGKEVLLGQVVSQIKSPLYGLQNALLWNFRKLVLTLNAVHSQKAA